MAAIDRQPVSYAFDGPACQMHKAARWTLMVRSLHSTEFFRRSDAE